MEIRPPRALLVLGALSMVLGLLGFGRALKDQVGPYAGSQEAFVSAERREIELRNSLQTPEVASEIVQKAGDQLGERGWTRRGIVLPLGVANLLLSLMLFIGAMRAVTGSAWGHGAWQFAAAINVPYTIVAAVVAFVAARDGWDANLALATNLSLQFNIPAESLADWELLRERAFTCLGAAVEVGFYVSCWIYLGRARIRALYSEKAGS